MKRPSGERALALLREARAQAPGDAEVSIRVALRLARRAGARVTEAEALTSLATVLSRDGRGALGAHYLVLAYRVLETTLDLDDRERARVSLALARACLQHLDDVASLVIAAEAVDAARRSGLDADATAAIGSSSDIVAAIIEENASKHLAPDDDSSTAGGPPPRAS